MRSVRIVSFFQVIFSWLVFFFSLFLSLIEMSLFIVTIAKRSYRVKWPFIVKLWITVDWQTVIPHGWDKIMWDENRTGEMVYIDISTSSIKLQPFILSYWLNGCVLCRSAFCACVGVYWPKSPMSRFFLDFNHIEWP